MLTAERLRQLVHYDPATGVFTWLADRGPRKAGETTVGSLTNKGYLLLCVDYRRYMAHRLAWLYMTGEWPKALVDHRDRNRMNNVWTNLRSATYVENGQNSVSTYHRSGQGVRGVSPFRGKWRAVIQVDGRQKHLGTFATQREAGAAYQAARAQHHAFFQPA